MDGFGCLHQLVREVSRSTGYGLPPLEFVYSTLRYDNVRGRRKYSLMHARRNHVSKAERVIGELCGKILGTWRTYLALVRVVVLLLLLGGLLRCLRCARLGSLRHPLMAGDPWHKCLCCGTTMVVGGIILPDPGIPVLWVNGDACGYRWGALIWRLGPVWDMRRCSTLDDVCSSRRVVRIGRWICCCASGHRL